MQVVNVAVTGTATQAAEIAKKWKKTYPKVTRVAHKTTAALRRSAPGRYGASWYEVKAWR